MAKSDKVKVHMIATVIDGGRYSAGETYEVPYSFYELNKNACIIVKSEKKEVKKAMTEVVEKPLTGKKKPKK